uniref:Uncharacterized protein n=1 Tax=Rhizophora mucronata TaxID=61149 RepID=A0A2P2J386_RHIMU
MIESFATFIPLQYYLIQKLNVMTSAPTRTNLRFIM